jgi:CheY-like chemotaxis protein
MTGAGNEGRAIYASAAVERMLGQSTETIRKWERLYGLTPPTRSPGGQILYSRDDVERLRRVAEDLAAGREPALSSPADLPDERAAEGDQAPQLLVLLAERDPRAADLEEFFLRTEGYGVDVTFTAGEAAAQAVASPPDVALVELSLSGHAGLELCRHLRTITKAPIIAASNLDRRDEAFAAGVSAFLLKPLDPLLLVSTIKDLLGESAFLKRRTED